MSTWCTITYNTNILMRGTWDRKGRRTSTNSAGRESIVGSNKKPSYPVLDTVINYGLQTACTCLRCAGSGRGGYTDKPPRWEAGREIRTMLMLEYVYVFVLSTLVGAYRKSRSDAETGSAIGKLKQTTTTKPRKARPQPKNENRSAQSDRRGHWAYMRRIQQTRGNGPR